jgi:hypothetical protein
VQLRVRDAAAAQRGVSHRRQQILRLPDPCGGDDEPLAVFVRADTDDVGAQAAEQPALPVQRFRRVDQLRQQRRKPRPWHRAFRAQHVAQPRPLDQIGDEVDEIAFLAVVADLEDRGMRHLERPRLAEKSRADGVPVAIGTLAQQPDGDRTAERAVRAVEILAAETSRTERLAQLVGAEQSACGRRRGDAGHDRRRSRRAAVARQRGGEGRDRGIPVVGRFRERAAQHHVDPRRQIGPDLRRRTHRVPEQRGDEPARILFVERQTPRQHLVDDDGETVLVRPRVHRAADELLGSGVAERPDELMRGGQPCVLGAQLADEAEIHDLVEPRASAEVMRDDVRGLQVAMQDPVVVRELQRAADRQHDRLHVADREGRPLGDLLPQAAAVQELHDEERPAFGVEIEVEDRDDVRVAELRAGAALAQEALARARVAGRLRADDLHGDLVAEQPPPRPEHGAHAAFRERCDHLVPAVEDGPGCEHGHRLHGLHG